MASSRGWPYLLTGGLHVNRIVRGHLWLLYYRGHYYVANSRGLLVRVH